MEEEKGSEDGEVVGRGGGEEEGGRRKVEE